MKKVLALVDKYDSIRAVKETSTKGKIMFDHFDTEINVEETHFCRCHEIAIEALEEGVECDMCQHWTEREITKFELPASPKWG